MLQIQPFLMNFIYIYITIHIINKYAKIHRTFVYVVHITKECMKKCTSKTRKEIYLKVFNWTNFGLEILNKNFLNM